VFKYTLLKTGAKEAVEQRKESTFQQAAGLVKGRIKMKNQ